MIGGRDLSLRWKIPLRVMVAVLGTAVAVTAALMVWEYDEMRQSLAGHAKSLGRVLANTLVGPVLHDDIWRSFEIIQSARETFPAAPELQADLVLVTDSEFRVFVASRPRDFPIGASPATRGGVWGEMRARLADADPATQRILEPDDSTHFFVMTPLVADGIALGHVILGYSKVSFVPRFLGLVKRAAWVTLLVLAVILPVSWAWARRTGAPLLHLAEAMRQLPKAPDDSLLRDLPQSGDEIGQLGEAFRRMVAELRQKKELESQMLASERLAAVGRLSAGIAHEINNPLGGMLTAIKTYQRHGAGDPLAAQTLSLLERGLTQIRNTVAALLVETKARDRFFEPADIDDLLILIESEAQLRAVAVVGSSVLKEALPLPATLLRQILLNLLLNAVAAADEGGKVWLSVAAARGTLRLVVGNDGQHIAEARMPYLFEPFTSDKEQGHGLGLWVVYQIVRELNGGISVESEPGRTTFTIEIPYAESA